MVLKKIFGEATKPSHWVGRILSLALYASLCSFFVPIRVSEHLTTFGTPFALAGIIYCVQGFGIELFPSEVVEEASRPRPATEVSIVRNPGTGKIMGLFWIVVGLVISWWNG